MAGGFNHRLVGRDGLGKVFKTHIVVWIIEFAGLRSQRTKLCKQSVFGLRRTGGEVSVIGTYHASIMRKPLSPVMSLTT